jgi:hypothetical protein
MMWGVDFEEGPNLLRCASVDSKKLCHTGINILQAYPLFPLLSAAPNDWYFPRDKRRRGLDVVLK